MFTDIDLSYVDEYSCKANNSLQKDVKSVNVIVQCEWNNSVYNSYMYMYILVTELLHFCIYGTCKGLVESFLGIPFIRFVLLIHLLYMPSTCCSSLHCTHVHTHCPYHYFTR